MSTSEEPLDIETGSWPRDKLAIVVYDKEALCFHVRYTWLEHMDHQGMTVGEIMSLPVESRTWTFGVETFKEMLFALQDADSCKTPNDETRGEFSARGWYMRKGKLRQVIATANDVYRDIRDRIALLPRGTVSDKDVDRLLDGMGLSFNLFSTFLINSGWRPERPAFPIFWRMLRTEGDSPAY